MARPIERRPTISRRKFDTLAPVFGMRDGPARHAAREMLATGIGPTEAGRKAGCSPQSASNAVRRFLRKLAVVKRQVRKDAA